MNSFVIAGHLVKRVMANKKGMLGLFVLPALLISGIVYFNLQDSNFKKYSIDYVNMDSGILGEKLIKSLDGLPNVEMKKTSSPEQLKVKVANQKTAAAFIIPKDFSKKARDGDDAEIIFLQLGRNAVNYSIQFAAGQIVSQWSTALKSMNDKEQKRYMDSLGSPLIETKLGGELLYINPKPKLREVDGLMLLFIMGIIGHAAVQMAEERKNGTLRRIFAAPVHAWEILAGNFIGTVFIGTLQILLVLFVTRIGLGFDYGTPPLFQLLVLELFLLASVGLASAVAGMLRDSRYLYTIQLSVVIPTCMIGGCFWGVEDMPAYMQKIALFVPQSWAIDALRLLKDGADLADIGYHLGILFVFAVLLLSFGAYVFKPQNEA